MRKNNTFYNKNKIVNNYNIMNGIMNNSTQINIYTGNDLIKSLNLYWNSIINSTKSNSPFHDSNLSKKKLGTKTLSKRNKKVRNMKQFIEKHMKEKKINAVFVGCDRVAANGDAANKIGTSVVATVAKHYNVPFYVCAPTSTIDINTPTGADINIEQRKPEEVTEMWYKERMAPEGVKVYNPAFDVTDNELISGIVTEYGVLRAPYDEAISRLFSKKI